MSDKIRMGHLSFAQRAECENKKEIIFLSPTNSRPEAPEASIHENITSHLHSTKQFPAIHTSESICSCGEVSKKCHVNAKCVQKDFKDSSTSWESLEHICVSKEMLTRLKRISGDYEQGTCDQVVNNAENKLIQKETTTTVERPKNLISNFIERSGLKSSVRERIQNAKEMFRTNATENSKKYKHIYQTLKKKSDQQSTTSENDGFTSVIINATPPQHTDQLTAASIHQPSTTKRHHSTHKQPKTSPTMKNQLNSPKPNSKQNSKSPKQFSLKTRPEFRRFYEWVSKRVELGEDGHISDVKTLRKWIHVFFDTKKGTNKKIKQNSDQNNVVNNNADVNNSDVDSFDEKLIFNSRLSHKRQVDSYPYEPNPYYAVTNEVDLSKETKNSTNDSAIVYDTFVNRQVLLWFSSLAEPRWIKSHINANAEKFSLYVVLFVFLGVISTMGAVIYRLFFQVKSHKNYIIGKKTVEKENIDDNEDGNNEEKEKDPLQKEQQEGEEKFNSPGNWRTPESESSTGDDRTLRDDEHGNISNIERADSRHVMCTIVSQERSLDEISQVEQRQHDANNNNQPEEQAPSSHMMSSMLQQTSSPPLSAITNHSSSPPQSPNIHHQPQHQQPSLPSPPGSFMFEPPPPNELNPIIVDSSIVTVHSPKMIDDDNPDVNTLARRSRELY